MTTSPLQMLLALVALSLVPFLNWLDNRRQRKAERFEKWCNGKDMQHVTWRE